MGPGDLRGMLSGLGSRTDKRLLVDMRTSDDAGVVRLDRDRGLVHTIDVITPIVDDPATFGRVAAANAVSDVFAMGGTPMSAVSLLSVPKGLPNRAVTAMMSAAEELLFGVGALLVGGHTVKDQELKLGFAVTGTVEARRMVTNSGAKPKDRLLLTKALGTGVLYQAMKAERRTAAETRALVASMTTVNDRAAQAMVDAGVRCATDVTGFGLAGHALNIARASDVDLILEAVSLPALPGVRAYIADGLFPGPVRANWKGYGKGFSKARRVDPVAKVLVADPQTSGGMLICVSPRKAERLRAQLDAVDIGEVRPKRADRPVVRLM